MLLSAFLVRCPRPCAGSERHLLAFTRRLEPAGARNPTAFLRWLAVGVRPLLVVPAAGARRLVPVRVTTAVCRGRRPRGRAAPAMAAAHAVATTTAAATAAGRATVAAAAAGGVPVLQPSCDERVLGSPPQRHGRASQLSSHTAPRTHAFMLTCLRKPMSLSETHSRPPVLTTFGVPLVGQQLVWAEA